MATAEYAALSLLVSAAVAAGGSALDGGGVATAVADGVQRALCTVAGGGCDARGRPRPCVVASHTRAREAHVSALLLRLTDGRRVLRERLSDGTVRVTVVQSSGAGGVLGTGIRLDVRGLAVHADLEASAGTGAGYGRTFLVADERAADRLVARLAEQDWKVGGVAKGIARFTSGASGGEEVERFLELQSGGSAGAALALLKLDGAASAVAQRASAVRVDRRTGARALVLRVDAGMGGDLDARVAQLAGGGGLQRALELELDRRNRPVALVLRAAGAVRGREGGDRAEVEAHLDLAEPVARALGERLLGGDAGALRPLAARLWDQARMEVRRYAVTEGPRSSSGASLGMLGKAAYGVSRTAVGARLVAASGRDPGAGWTRRLDCELAAGAPLAA